MTLEISYNNKNIMKHSFITAVKGSYVPSLISFIALFLAFVVVNPLFFGPSYAPSIDAHRANYIFSLYDPALSPFIVGIIICTSAICALLTFMFLYKTNMVTLYFSLGLSRKKLFVTRYLAGITMSIAPILLIMLVALVTNVLVLGTSMELITAFSYLLLGFVVLSVLAFAITSLMCTLCGTLVEGILLSAFGLGGISLLILGFNFMMNLFLFGNAYGVFSYTYQPSIQQNIIHLTTAVNPLMYFLNDARIYSLLRLDHVTETLPVALPKISGTTVTSWLIIGILLSILAINFFERRKAEITGVAGANKFGSFICTVIPTYFFFSLTLWVADPFVSRVAALLLATIIGLVVYVIIALGFRHFPFRNDVFKLPTVLAICFLSIAVLSTGGMGFSSRLPVVEDIERVYVSYKGSPDYQTSIGSGGTSGDGTYYFGVRDLEYTSKSDINRVLDIHQAIIEYGEKPVSGEAIVESPADYTIESEIVINYTLHDGGEFIRYYPATSLSNLMLVLSLDNTDFMKASISQAFQEDNASSVFTSGEIVLTDIFYKTEFNYEPNAGARSRLLDALRTDVSRQTVQQRYFPDSSALGVIVFTDNDYFNARHHDSKYGLIPFGVSKVFITEDFTQTIAFLKEEGLFEHFAFRGDIDYLTVKGYLINVQDERSFYNNARSHYFRSYQGDPDPLAIKITDQAEQNELLSKTRSNYFAAEGGYIVGVHLKDQGPVYMFLPEEDAPAFIKNI